MLFPILNRVAEANEHLKLVLDQLGLEARIKADAGSSPYIEFRSRDGMTFSPIAIELGPQALRVSQFSWAGSIIHATIFDEIDIGANGWKYQFYTSIHDDETLGDDPEDCWMQLEESLRTSGVVYDGRCKEKYTADQDFGEACAAIEDALSPFGEIEVTCERHPDADSYVFIDPSGRDWRVSFRDAQATISVGGKQLETLAAHALSKIGEAIGRHLSSLESKPGPVR